MAGCSFWVLNLGDVIKEVGSKLFQSGGLNSDIPEREVVGRPGHPCRFLLVRGPQSRASTCFFTVSVT